MSGGVKKVAERKVETHGHGFTELQYMLKGDAEEMEKVSSILIDTVKYIDMFKKSQGAKMQELKPNDPKF